MNKFISFTLCVIISLGGITTMTSCDTAQNNYTLSFVTTPINAHEKTTDHPCYVQFDDTLFISPPHKFSKELAYTALTLSSAAYSYTYALDNLETLGFEHLSKFNYGDNYKPHAVGEIIASKKLGGTTIVAIILRGTYEKEWYSNFDIGHDVNGTKVHAGFSKATDYALGKLEMYLGNYGIDRDHCKFLVTGHSRGGAVANLVSKELIDEYGPDNVYGYTFATPNTTTDENASTRRYAGIFNFINPEDFISYIPLKEWGFTKYGTTIAFPANNGSTAYEDKLARVSRYYEELKGRPLVTYGTSDDINGFLSSAYRLAPTIKDYYDTKYEIAGLSLSLYEYMNIVSHVLNEENLISNGLIMLSSDNTKFKPITDFITKTTDNNSGAISPDFENSMIAYAHTAETYLAWLKVYLEDI